MDTNLTFTNQWASISHTEAMKLLRQNFGFNLERDVNRVALDPKEEHYYLEVRKKAS